MRRPLFFPLRPRTSGTVSPVTEDSVPAPGRTRRQRRQDKKDARRGAVLLGAGDTPVWVDRFRRWGVPVSAVLVLVLCAPGEQHLASLSGWHGWISWGMAGLFTLYAGLAAIISTQLPEGAKGKTSSVWGAVFSLGLAMGAQPVAHLFVTGWLTATPRPPIELVITVSSVPPLILGHLLHFAAMPPRRPVPQDTDVPLTPDATVTPLRRTPAPRPAPVLSPRPVVSAAASRPVLVPGTAGRFTGQGTPSMSARALSLFEDGTPEDKVRDTLKIEYASSDGTPPKANTINKAVTRAKDKLSLRP